METQSAERDEYAIRIALLEDSTRKIKEELHKLNKNIVILIWLVVLAVGSSSLNWIFRGVING